MNINSKCKDKKAKKTSLNHIQIIEEHLIKELGANIYICQRNHRYDLLDDTEIAFRSKSKSELRKAYYLFKLIGKPLLSRLGGQIANMAIKLHIPITGLIKTIFQQFCGGENIENCSDKIDELARHNIATILDYSVEGKASEKDFKKTMEQTIAVLNFAHKNKNIPFAVFKITGLARFQLLEKINLDEELSTDEQQEYDRVIHRINKICKKAHQYKIPIMIDAEESWIQDAIDSIVEAMMITYNKEEVIIYNTIQMYRQDRLDYLKKYMKTLKKMDTLLV